MAKSRFGWACGAAAAADVSFALMTAAIVRGGPGGGSCCSFDPWAMIAGLALVGGFLGGLMMTLVLSVDLHGARLARWWVPITLLAGIPIVALARFVVEVGRMGGLGWP